MGVDPLTQPLPVLISGAGIGGLALARALIRAGVPCRVFERAPVLGEVGSGLGVTMNAIRALEHIGLGERVRDIGAPLSVAAARAGTAAVLGPDLLPRCRADDAAGAWRAAGGTGPLPASTARSLIT